MTTCFGPVVSQVCSDCHRHRSALMAVSRARVLNTAAVCSRVSETVRLNIRVSFSGCSRKLVVVTISPVGPSRSITPGNKAIPRLFDRLIAQAAFGQEGPDKITGELGRHAGRLVDHQKPMLQRLSRIRQGALAHGGQRMVRLLGKELERGLDKERLASR